MLSERAKAAEDFAEKNRKGGRTFDDAEENEMDVAMTQLAQAEAGAADDADDVAFVAVLAKKVVKKEPEMMNPARRRMMLQVSFCDR